MTDRNSQVEQAALSDANQFYPDSKIWNSKDGNYYRGFISGARWADKFPAPSEKDAEIADLKKNFDALRTVHEDFKQHLYECRPNIRALEMVNDTLRKQLEQTPPTLSQEERERVRALKDFGTGYDDNTDIDWLISLVERLAGGE